MMSTVLPAAAGTITFKGFAGQVWASAPAASRPTNPIIGSVSLLGFMKTSAVGLARGASAPSAHASHITFLYASISIRHKEWHGPAACTNLCNRGGTRHGLESRPALARGTACSVSSDQ